MGCAQGSPTSLGPAQVFIRMRPETGDANSSNATEPKGVSIRTSARTPSPSADCSKTSASHLVRRCGAWITRSRSPWSVVTGAPVASSNPALPAGPHASSLHRVAMDSRAQRMGANSGRGISRQRLACARSSGVTHVRTARGAMNAANRSDRVCPRMPTGIELPLQTARRTTTTGVAAIAALTQSGRAHGANKASIPEIQRRSCGRTVFPASIRFFRVGVLITRPIARPFLHARRARPCGIAVRPVTQGAMKDRAGHAARRRWH